jgi:hypothetical protein
MVTFADIYEGQTIGELTMFDRIIFKGHLTGLYGQGRFSWFLHEQDVLLKDFGRYVKKTSAEIKSHAEVLAQSAGRPYIYLAGAKTKRKGQSKEELVREIAREEGVIEGLVCVLATLEINTSFDVRGNRQTQHKEVVYRPRKHLHFYFYYLDPEFGLMHIRLQSWFPFEIQIYINGRAWLAQQMNQAGIEYTRYNNCFVHIEELSTAQALCDKFAHRKWAGVLNVFAKRVNPFLETIEQSGFGGYYWSINQAEIATDVMFPERATLETILPDLFQEATLAFSADDVMRFLGRKLNGNFQGEVTTDLKKRLEGYRVKHWMKNNAIKMYDKASVLRIETTINNSREFKTLKVEHEQRRWVPMNKGVSNFWRFYQVGQQANKRYLAALAQVHLKGEGLQALDALCQPKTKQGKRIARFNPITKDDCQLFAAVMSGEHLINGFRNRDLRLKLFGIEAQTPSETKRLCARVSRLIAKLRGHGLISKVKDARLYRITKRGFRAMSAALRYRSIDFPTAFCVS